LIDLDPTSFEIRKAEPQNAVQTQNVQNNRAGSASNETVSQNNKSVNNSTQEKEINSLADVLQDIPTTKVALHRLSAG
jgi:hypothetical protein